MARASRQGGQASVELVAVIGFLLVVLLALAQLAIAGYALWSAGEAARAGARAALVGGDTERAARSALPEWLGAGAAIDAGGPIEVRVAAPALLPGVGAIALSAVTELGVGDGR